MARPAVNPPCGELARYWRKGRTVRPFDLAPGHRPAGYVIASEDSRAFDDPGTLLSTVRTPGRRQAADRPP